MASRLWSGSVKHTPAAVGGSGFSGRVRPLLSGNTCRFGFKRPAKNASLQASSQRLACSAPPSTVATANPSLPPPSPPSDFKASPVPLLLVPRILLDKDEYDLKNEEIDQFVFYSLSKEEIVTVVKNQKSWRKDQIRHAHWLGSSKGWVMFMNRRDCNLYLSNPFSPFTSPIIPLPPIETLPYVTARLFRRRRSESGETDEPSTDLDFEFLLHEWYSKPEENEKKVKKWFEAPLPFKPPITDSSQNLIGHGFISKMVLSSPPPSPSNQYEHYRNCIVAIIYGSEQRLAICRLGDKTWTPLDGKYYREIAFSKHEKDQKLCLYTYDGDFKSCHLSNTKSFSPKWKWIRNLDYEDGFSSYFLVESATEPEHLLVIRSSYENDVMDVHRLNLSQAKQKWARVDSLDDQALFVGDYSETLAVPATQLPARVKPNCIYFTHFDPFHLGVFSLDEKMEDLEAFDDGVCLDLWFKEDHEEENGDDDWFWIEKYRNEGEGWAVWVVPNPW